MEYTLSIFLPEANLNEKDVIQFDILAQITNLPKF